MQPPRTMNVLDQHGGFTAVTNFNGQKGPSNGAFDKITLSAEALGDVLDHHRYDTLWRPGQALKKGTEGRLVLHDQKSFYQCNNDVTIAFYKVPGYAYLVACWFDNKTGERIA